MRELEALAVQAINERFNLRAARLLLSQMKLTRVQRVQKALDEQFDALEIPPRNRFIAGGNDEPERVIMSRLRDIANQAECAFFAVLVEGLKEQQLLRNGAVELWKQKCAEYSLSPQQVDEKVS